MKPFSDNLIFFDTEFSSLDPYQGELLSLGMVKMDGTELYIEIEHEGAVSPWALEHVLLSLTEPKVTRAVAREMIFDFMGKDRPFLISYVVQYDAAYLYKLLAVGEEHGSKFFPFEWITLDFASILFALGRDPKSAGQAGKIIQEMGLDISKLRKHHALDDARLLREVYLKLFDKK